jgi:hypothetical protein
MHIGGDAELRVIIEDNRLMGLLRSLPTSAASATAPIFPAPTDALWPGTCFTYIQCAVAEQGAVQFGNRLLAIFRTGHLHESEPTRLARIAVLHDADAIDRTVSCEQLAQLVFTGIKAKVPNENVLQVDAPQLSYLSVSCFGGHDGG